jgi:hypothetical protein
MRDNDSIFFKWDFIGKERGSAGEVGQKEAKNNIRKYWRIFSRGF